MGATNAVLVRWTGGNTWETDPASIAAIGRSEAVLKLPGITSAGQARTVARAFLAARGHPRTRTTAGHLPTGPSEEPFTGYNVGDLITAPGPAGTPAVLRVQSVTVNELDDGTLDFVPELGDTIDEEFDRLERFLSKFGTAPVTENGASSGGDEPLLGGGDPVYNPIPPIDPNPVPPTDPWVDPTLTDPDLTGTTTIGNTDPTDPDLPDPDDPGLLNIFATVIVPGPDDGQGGGGLDDPALKITPDLIEIGDDTELKVKGDETHAGDTTYTGTAHVGLAGVMELLEDYYNQGSSPGSPRSSGLIKAKGADVNRPELGLIIGGVRSLVGRLSGPRGDAVNATYINKNGDWHFGGNIDLSDANVTVSASSQKDVLRFGKAGRLRTSTGIPPVSFDYAINVYKVVFTLGTSGSGLNVDVNLGGTTLSFGGSGSDSTGWSLPANTSISVVTTAGGTGNFGASVEIFYTH